MQKLQDEGKTRFLGATEMLTMDSKHDGMSMSMEKHPDVWDSVMLKYGIMNQWAAKAALPLWIEFMTEALAQIPYQYFDIPDNMVKVRMDPFTGRLAPEDAVGAVAALFKKGTEPRR